MGRLALVVVPAVVLVGALLGWLLPLPVALIATGIAGIGLATWLWQRESTRVTRIAEHVGRWLGTSDHEPVDAPAGEHWQALATAVNSLGAAHARRGANLRRERPWRRQLVDAVTFPALLFDREGLLVVANARAREELGIRISGRLTAIQAVGSSALADTIDKARERGEPVEVEARVGNRELWAVASPVGDEVVLTIVDRTAERRLAEVRRDFVANASHELKTPVAGIQALADALDVVVERDPGRVRDLVARLRGESERLTKLVHDLLDLQRLQDGVVLDRVPVDLVSVLRGEIDRVRARAESRGLEVRVTLPDSAVVVGAPDDLRLLIGNLLDNAVQYNRPGGRVEVGLERLEGVYELVVRDTGIGIPQQDLDRIFERFYRVDVARSRETGGTGLGLSIVRHAVERHGGSVSVESLLGEGTTFRVMLPVEPG